MSSEGLVSCDTFIVMRDSTVSGETIFGKNSDRPKGEIQEVVFIPSEKHESKTLKCTYITVEQVPVTYAVFLSKPEWMWGAEMGANEFGVVIGNEAVWNRLSESSHDLVPRLLGMDLLRLGLERSKTAREGLEVITGLLEKYGQGGQCSNIIHDFSYHNSFLIADSQEAWILETADKLWAAEHVETGYRNISNCMSITTKMDRCHPDLKSRAKSEGWWDGLSEFDWSDVIGNTSGDLENPDSRFSCGRELLKERCEGRKFNVKNMMEVLRDEASGINRPSGDFPTAGSQVSILAKNSGTVDIHWFTATLCPTRSIFKPVSFSMPDLLTDATSSDSDKSKDRKHLLWFKQDEATSNTSLQTSIEDKYIKTALENRTRESFDTNLFNQAVEEELALYAA